MPRKKTPKGCGCGCGGQTKGGVYLPGHDARHRAAVFEAARAGDKSAVDLMVHRGWNPYTVADHREVLVDLLDALQQKDEARIKAAMARAKRVIRMADMPEQRKPRRTSKPADDPLLVVHEQKKQTSAMPDMALQVAPPSTVGASDDEAEKPDKPVNPPPGDDPLLGEIAHKHEAIVAPDTHLQLIPPAFMGSSEYEHKDPLPSDPRVSKEDEHGTFALVGASGYPLLDLRAPRPVWVDQVLYPTPMHAWYGSFCEGKGYKESVAETKTIGWLKRKFGDPGMPDDGWDAYAALGEIMVAVLDQHPEVVDELLRLPDNVDGFCWNGDDPVLGYANGDGENVYGDVLSEEYEQQLAVGDHVEEDDEPISF